MIDAELKSKHESYPFVGVFEDWNGASGMNV